ncbi:Beta-porphyranase A precursor [Planctomycetes bacterium MalM25]|nr:Beta-porphyranase A precursor [Planctomycetes bacterium MalM25]
MGYRFFSRARKPRRSCSSRSGRGGLERLEPRQLLTTVVADYVDQYATPAPAFGWQYLWNESGALGTPSNYTAMVQDSWRYRPTTGESFPYLGATFAHPGSGVDEADSGGIDRYAIAAFTVSVAGEYSITDSLINRDGANGDGVEVVVHVNSQPVTQLLSLGPASSDNFDSDLGNLSVGDTIYVGIGPDGPGGGSSKGNDGVGFDFSITLGETEPEPPVTVSIDLETQRYLSGVSDLDRDKFFTHHSGNTSDSQISAFRSEYEVERGRQFWGPLPYAKQQTGQVGVYPNTTPSTDQSVRPVSQVVHTGHPRDALRYDTDVQAAADYVTTYYTTVVNDVPEFYEPMNEPFVHAGDSEFSDAPSTEAMRLKMAELYAAIGEAVDDTPALANMNVVGYASAWPSMELWDFGHWDSRMKMFMDVAGEHMDAFSTHLYDGVNVTGQNTRRSGSNSEAILDLIETYSHVKWGEVKPHAITEYGGIESGYGDTYTDIRSAQSLRSINHLLFNLLEREDDLLISIPFITDKATWFLSPGNNCEPYGAALWKHIAPTASCNGPYEYTWKVKFFDLWKDVQGERGVIDTSDPDVQAQLFIDGNTAYVAVNNLADSAQTIDLELLSGMSGLQNVELRQMEIPSSASLEPTYTETVQANAPESVTLQTGGTAVLVYNFDSPIEFNKTVHSEKYYTTTHLQPINADQAINFNFDGVQTASEGEATLRMSIGRKHDRSKAPEVTVNGTQVDVPADWKGYDQANRDDFFGMIEIPVAIELLQANNDISVTFPDTGGRVSSMILAVEAVEAPLPGDYDRDADVDLLDMVYWRNAYGGVDEAALQADGNGDGVVNAADYTVWRDIYEAIPAATASQEVATATAPAPVATEQAEVAGVVEVTPVSPSLPSAAAMLAVASRAVDAAAGDDEPSQEASTGNNATMAQLLLISEALQADEEDQDQAFAEEQAAADDGSLETLEEAFALVS